MTWSATDPSIIYLGKRNMNHFLSKTSKWVFALGVVYHLPVSCGDRKANRSVSVPESFVPGSFLIERNQGTSEEAFQASIASIAKSHHCELEAVKALRWDSKLASSEPQASKGVAVGYAPLTHTSMVKVAGCDLGRQPTRHLAVELSNSEAVANVEIEAQYALANNGSDPLGQWQDHHKSIQTDAACKYTQEDAPEIIVAVVDTGVDMQHPDLKDRFVTRNGKAICANFVGKGSDEQPDGNCQDDNGHGTHVAGTIAANLGNGIGGYGVAACTNVKILNVKAMDAKGKGKVSQINRGVKWAIDQGAQFVNLSIVSFAEIRDSDDFQSSLYDYAAEKNVMVIAAAGNSGEKNGEGTYAFPASFDHVVSVGAVNSSGAKADYSVYGPRIAVSAQGKVLSTYPTNLGKDHDTQSGTSMATPQVTGALTVAVSAVQSKLGLNGRYPAVEGKKVLMNSVRRNEALRGVFDSAGVIDAKLLTENMLASVSLENQKQDTDQAPLQDQAPTEMAFVGLKSGQNVAGKATSISLDGLPTSTRYVGLYWGVEPVDKETAASHFSLKPIADGSSELRGNANWILPGENSLFAVAYDARGKLLQKISINLKG